MNTQQMAERRAELLRKRWAGSISSEEHDELDGLTDALRKLARASWHYELDEVLLPVRGVRN